jgi:predicted dehydrogenase
MTEYGVGVVGCGGISQSRHIPAWKRIPHMKLIAVADQNKERALSVGSRFGVKSYNALTEMLRDQRISVVDICTPVESHVELALQCIENEKDVIVEKPMAASSKDCEEMIKAARRNSRMLYVAHTFRYYPAIQLLSRWIQGNQMGTVRHFSSLAGNDDDPRFPLWKKALWEFGLHRVDLVRYLLGDIVTLDADLLQNLGISIRLGTRSSSATLAIVKGQIREEILVVGEKADAWLASLALDTAVLSKHRQESSYTTGTIRYNLDRLLGYARCLAYSTTRHAFLGVRATAHYACLRDFAENLIRRRESAVVTADDAMLAVSCLERVEKILEKKTSWTPLLRNNSSRKTPHGF